MNCNKCGKTNKQYLLVSSVTSKSDNKININNIRIYYCFNENCEHYSIIKFSCDLDKGEDK